MNFHETTVTGSAFLPCWHGAFTSQWHVAFSCSRSPSSSFLSQAFLICGIKCSFSLSPAVPNRQDKCCFWHQKEHLTWCPRKLRPRWSRTPPAALRSGIQWRSRLILQAPLNVLRAQATSQRALSASDLLVTAESRERRPADGTVNYRLHGGSDFFTGLNERQLRAGLQSSGPGVSGAAELSSLCPWLAWGSGQVTGLTRPSLAGDHMQRSPTSKADLPVRGDGRSPWGMSVTDSNGSFLHWEAWEGWATLPRLTATPPGFWHQVVLPVNKRQGLFHEQSGNGP